jgi:hypothetical protein
MRITAPIETTAMRFMIILTPRDDRFAALEEKPRRRVTLENSGAQLQ